MCGFAGFLQPRGGRHEECAAVVEAMRDTLEHRGPDDACSWVDAGAGIAIGFRRLAILDLTSEGRQPMASASGRYIVAFNGEVYNFAELRTELAARGHVFRGRSDTEVILAACEQWGPEDAVRRFVGMFALVLWDRSERALTLVRDRLGIKPVYYGFMGGTFLFGSELKSLRAHPAFRAELDRGALALYTRYGYVPQPYSIYHAVYKLPPGTTLSVGEDALGASVAGTPKPYWSAFDVAMQGIAGPLRASEQDAAEALDGLIRSAVGMRMVADVPLGAFLSGGVDSSTVVGVMQAQSSRPVRTFSIGFCEEGYNEARHAAAVARHLGTDHTELYVTPSEAQAVIPSLPDIFDEPFSDSSQIPTYLVSRLTRRHVTVSLSGDGGDELFGGYPRYVRGDTRWRRIGKLPAGMRLPLGASLKAAARAVGTGRRNVVGRIGRRLRRTGEFLATDGPEDLYRVLVSRYAGPAPVVRGGSEPLTVLADSCRWLDRGSFIPRMMYLDTVTYLPDDILTKVDRASMAVSLEARVPLLDHRIVEFAWRLPMSLKVRGDQGKWILRKVLDRYVPRDLIERPKMGFGVPLGAWLRGPLRDWAEDLLSEERLRREGDLDPAPIRAYWNEHLSRQCDWSPHLWDALMYQSWRERWT